ncbi:SDR family NAD(P)-dependent oxidoreductase [Delftia sp. PS-11]|uniref:SDR family NAD(P)-dependent oxidoreductase n=1 Tax=Delftia sp. PS-11 TaxID=2767222 RepID=UPI002457A354|nr:SDR family oxidoreductase [Delftia sp. PS-11]KAJ8746236.1 SDR family oxidoreductase [Delftia sp. PS-11]
MTTSFNPFSLENQRILVTGSTSGLGKKIALTCAHMGAEVICTGRDQDRLEKTLTELQSISDRSHQAIQADLTQASGRDALVTSIEKKPLNGVVHSAGISRLSPVRMITEQHLREVQSINVDAPMLITQALLKRNLVAPEGSMVFIASIAAHIGVPGVAAYSGTKAALLAMVRCLAMEVVKRRIRANCLSPALVETPLLEATATMIGSMEQERGNYPLGFGKPEDVANAAVFLISGASRWITGTTLVMDGGLTIS